MTGGISDEQYARLTATDIADLVRSRQLSAVDVAAAALDRLHRLDVVLRAFVECWESPALAAARSVDDAVAAGAELRLAGVPLAVKAVEGPQSPRVRRLVAAGCVPIGATSVPDRSVAWQTWGRTDRGPTANPWSAGRSPGGSSAGSAAAVAAGIVPLATGSDGAGSIRIPAAWCGVVGLKVTNGRSPSRDPAGLTAFGPLARTVDDAARYAHCVFGDDVAERGPAGGGLPAVVWSADLGCADTDPAVADVAWSAVARLAQAGTVELRDIPVGLLDPGPAWRALRDPRGDHRVARQRQAENDRRLRDLFSTVDLILTPATPGPPHGHDGPGERVNTTLAWAFNLSGHPALSLPAGFTDDGLPLGLQVVARPGEEASLIALGRAWEALAPWPAPSVGPAEGA